MLSGSEEVRSQQLRIRVAEEKQGELPPIAGLGFGSPSGSGGGLSVVPPMKWPEMSFTLVFRTENATLHPRGHQCGWARASPGGSPETGK